MINPKEIEIMSVTTERSSDADLSGYLNDHLAREARGVALVERARSENAGSRLGTFLQLLSWAFEEDRDSLVQLMGALGVRRKHLGVIAAGTAERLGRLRLTGHSPLDSLAELEELDLRINDKLDMWNALRAGFGERVDGIDFDELISRAEGQADALERRRLAVAANALSGG